MDGVSHGLEEEFVIGVKAPVGGGEWGWGVVLGEGGLLTRHQLIVTCLASVSFYYLFFYMILS